MQLSTATLLHARTRDVDFRANLLAVPADFSQEDILYARRRIVSSTRYFEMAGSRGRRLVFSGSNYTVSGLSIRIGDLYRLCGRQPRYEFVDNNRVNYAFIGLVFPGGGTQTAVDIPYSVFLAEFEKYMQLRWEDENNAAALVPVKTAYGPQELPPAAKVSTLLKPSNHGVPQIIDSEADTVESVAAQALLLAARETEFVFCSDIPTAGHVRECGFTAVTTDNGARMLASLQNDIRTPPTVVPAKEAQQKEENRAAKPRKNKYAPVLAAAGILLFALLLWLFLKP